jgi:hypothetical protein
LRKDINEKMEQLQKSFYSDTPCEEFSVEQLLTFASQLNIKLPENIPLQKDGPSNGSLSFNAEPKSIICSELIKHFYASLTPEKKEEYDKIRNKRFQKEWAQFNEDTKVLRFGKIDLKIKKFH